MKNSMYKTLLKLPLLQGLSTQELTEILEKVKIEFIKYESKTEIVKQNEDCNRLIYILKGDVIARKVTSNKKMSIRCRLGAPLLIEPDSLFGKNTKYNFSYFSENNSRVSLLIIKKRDIFNTLLNYRIVALNLLNTLSQISQDKKSQIWLHFPETLENRILYFILSHSINQSKSAYLKISKTELSAHLKYGRNTIAKELDKLEEEGLIIKHISGIEVRDYKMLFKEFSRKIKKEKEKYEEAEMKKCIS